MKPVYSSELQTSLSPKTVSPQGISSRPCDLGFAIAQLNFPKREQAPESQSYTQHLQTIANLSPRQLGYPFRRWTISWLNYHLSNEHGFCLSDRQISRALQQLGISIQAASSSPEDWMPPSSRITVGNLASQAA